MNNVHKAGMTDRQCDRLQTDLDGFDRISENPIPGFIDFSRLLEPSPNIMVEGKYAQDIFRMLVDNISRTLNKNHTRVLNELSETFPITFSHMKDYYYINNRKNVRGIRLSILLDLLMNWKKICNKKEKDVYDVKLKIFKCPLYDGFNVANLPLSVNMWLAELVGILVGDGSMPKNKWYIQITVESKDFLRYASKLFMKLFKIPYPKIKKDKKSNSYTIRVRSKILVLYFMKFFNLPHGSKKGLLRVPPIIFNSEKKIIAAFIRGLFSADGCISSYTYKSRIHNVLSLEMCEEKLLEQVRDLLEKKFKIFFNLKETKRGSWVIYRNDKKTINKFLYNVGILDPILFKNISETQSIFTNQIMG